MDKNLIQGVEVRDRRISVVYRFLQDISLLDSPKIRNREIFFRLVEYAPPAGSKHLLSMKWRRQRRINSLGLLPIHEVRSLTPGCMPDSPTPAAWQQRSK
ncbi:MAG: hypothetical protein CMJ46_12550 [Planctomyces sp.]|nr:hypothetical protein [Planctomyces sp.]